VDELFLLSVVAALLVGVCIGLTAGVTLGKDRSTKVVVVHERPDGTIQPVLHEAPDSRSVNEKERHPLRSYSVNDSGHIEYSDGEVVDPTVFKVDPPAMRIIE